MASIADRWTMWSCRSGARCASERTSSIAYVSNAGGREERNVE